MKMAGPGFVTGASDDDPSGIATYSQTGAQFGYNQAWTALWTFPFMVAIQEMCGRIGVVTGKGLAGVIKKHYPKQLLYLAVGMLFLANTVNLGANLGAMASAAGLIIPLPFTVLLLIMTGMTLLLEIFVSYQNYSKYLKFLALSLLAYIFAAFMVKVNWLEVMYHAVTPKISFSSEYWVNIVAVLGTTISPYLFFWQANQEVEESVASGKLQRYGWGKPRIDIRDIRRMRKDTVIGMFFSNFVMFFIIIMAAVTLNAAGIYQVESASQAAEALRPLAGEMTFLLFTIGVVGTGMLGVPILAGSASYALAEAVGWKAGLYRKLDQAHGFYGAITVATVVGLSVNYMGVDSFRMLYYTAVVNGLIAPFLMVAIMMISNNSEVMGKYVNGWRENVFGWMITGVMAVAGVALIVDTVAKYWF